MSDNLHDTFKEIDRDLNHSWIDLSAKVRDLASGLKLKAAGTSLAPDADHLSQQASMLCDHVERIHADVINLLSRLESQLPLPESDPSATSRPTKPNPDEIGKEAVQIQREHHELRNDFKDVLKALFMWRDDPEERLREKQ
ncbi:hypothetical protein HZ994_05770 [Akkermansiaceae bacterium]|nr:hypothetical protein HZ994_05770 [Akkermansiaceae bacterium]